MEGSLWIFINLIIYHLSMIDLSWHLCQSVPVPLTCLCGHHKIFKQIMRMSHKKRLFNVRLLSNLSLKLAFLPRISSASISQTTFCSWTHCRSRLWGRPRVSPRMSASGPAALMAQEEVQAVNTTTLLNSPCHPTVVPLWTVVSTAISRWTKLQNWSCLEAQTIIVTVLLTESLKQVRGRL